jgi:hypothetical protein
LAIKWWDWCSISTWAIVCDTPPWH